MIPARTATAEAQSGNIEWPQDTANKPLPRPPAGIQHHYCRLALLQWDGTMFTSVEDCRRLFPPVTELTSLFYVSGDGQEAMPGEPLPQLLQVGVFTGTVIGDSAIFMGNQDPNYNPDSTSPNITLRNVSRVNQKAANLMTITDF